MNTLFDLEDNLLLFFTGFSRSAGSILDELQAFVEENFSEWIAEKSLGKPPVVYEKELREPMVRVEEELKHQRELMQQGFALMEKRFEQTDRRFEQADNNVGILNSNMGS